MDSRNAFLAFLDPFGLFNRRKDTFEISYEIGKFPNDGGSARFRNAEQGKGARCRECETLVDVWPGLESSQ